MGDRAPRVALLSLEPWDTTWRRNQHLAAHLVEQRAVASLLFVAPPRPGFAARASSCRPLPGVEVLTPPLLVPRRAGGHAVLAGWLRRRLSGVDVVWVNDPVAGAGAVRGGQRALYDVTDDWRVMAQGPRERRRTVAAEDRLARRATTVVCSAELARRWQARYGVTATVVPNAAGVGAAGPSRVAPVGPAGTGPHAVYAGTLHTSRLDVGLVADLARAGVATVHLVGPDHLNGPDRDRLTYAGVRFAGPVAHEQVPAWLAGADVLICPHVVDDFTRSLDAIKGHEYLATDRPVVATASSGFEHLQAPGLSVAPRAGFVAAVAAALAAGPAARPPATTWAQRATEFAAVLDRVHRGGAA